MEEIEVPTEDLNEIIKEKVEEAENEKNRELGVVMCVKNEDNLPHH